MVPGGGVDCGADNEDDGDDDDQDDGTDDEDDGSDGSGSGDCSVFVPDAYVHDDENDDNKLHHYTRHHVEQL